MNQCDGCRRGLPIDNGIHRGEGYDMIACTRDRYEAPELQQRDPEPVRILYLNDGDEGLIFRRHSKTGELDIFRADESDLWEEYYRDLPRGLGFLVWDGQRVFRPDNWNQLTEDQKEDAAENFEGGFQFYSYEEVMTGTWRPATAADLIEVGAITVNHSRGIKWLQKQRTKLSRLLTTVARVSRIKSPARP